jgi:hypothetical protein
LKKIPIESNIKDLTQLEMRVAEGHETPWLPDEESSLALSAAMYRSRVSESNYRKAEALGMLGTPELLQQMRTSLARGNFLEAQNHLNHWNSQYQNQKPSVNSCENQVSGTKLESNSDEGEWLLERLRLAAFERRWLEVTVVCETELPSSLMPLTRISILQVHALALYELGQFTLALRALEKIQSLATLYPVSQSAFYAKILQAKILATAGDFYQADKIRRELWMTELNQVHHGLNGFLTLLRLDASLKRLRGQNPRPEILAGMKICQLMGDGYYESLSHFEVLLSTEWSNANNIVALNFESDSEIQKQAPSLGNLCAQGLKNYLGLDRLWQEVTEGVHSATVRELTQQRKFSHNNLENELHEAYRAKRCVFMKEGFIFELAPVRILQVDPSTQLWRAMQFIAENQKNEAKSNGNQLGTSKETLFTHLYPQLPYLKWKHDPLLFQLARRMRQKLDVDLVLKNGCFSIEACLFVG